MDALGISAFLTESRGFQGDIKVKCEDFVVREINLHTGKMAELASSLEVDDLGFQIESESESNKNNASIVSGSKEGEGKDMILQTQETRVLPVPHGAEIGEINDFDNTSPPKDSGLNDAKSEQDRGQEETKSQEELLRQEHCMSSASLSQRVRSNNSKPYEADFSMIQAQTFDGDNTYLSDSEFGADDDSLIAGASHVMKRFLSSVEQEEIENYADKVVAQKRLSDEKLTLVPVSFDNKEDRKKLHQAVRFLYPYLLTDTRRVPDGPRVFSIGENKSFQEFLTVLTREECFSLFRYIYCQDYSPADVFVLKNKDDRSTRTEIHKLVTKHFGALVESKTYKEDFQGAKKRRKLSNCGEESSSIYIRFRSKPSLQRKHLPSNSKFFKFVLKKTNCETFEAILKLCHITGVLAKEFSYAGTKDKKAVTYQWISVTERVAQKVFDLQNKQFMNIVVGNLTPAVHSIRLGDLLGNWFRIVIRNLFVPNHPCLDGLPRDKLLKHVKSVMDECVNDVAKHGFVNYFGSQRFGCEGTDAVSPDIGLHMLKGNFYHAVQRILQPNGCGDATDAAKSMFSATFDVDKTLRMMPNYKKRELVILKSLRRYGFNEEGCRKAIYSLPYTIRLMYIHSYLSLIWNLAATHRLAAYGQNVVAGDLAMIYSDHDQRQYKVVGITEADIKDNRFALCDVVLPLPGYKSEYPKHVLAEFYAKLLDKDGISETNFRIRDIGLNVPGSYRHLITNVSNIEFDLIEKDAAVSSSVEVSRLGKVPFYVNSAVGISRNMTNCRDVKLEVPVSCECRTESNKSECSIGKNFLLHAQSGLERKASSICHLNDDSVEGQTLDSVGNNEVFVYNCKDVLSSEDFYPKECQDTAVQVKTLPFTEERSNCIPVPCDMVLKFTLPPSCYATMFLRELMKSDTIRQ